MVQHSIQSKQEVKVIWQQAPHGGPIPRLVFHSNYRPRMHRLATVHARDNQPTNQPTTNDQQPTTNDQRRHDTAYLNKRLFY